MAATDAVKKNRSLLDGRWDKNDKKDSANVADLISQGKGLFYEHPSQEVRDLGLGTSESMFRPGSNIRSAT